MFTLTGTLRDPLKPEELRQLDEALTAHGGLTLHETHGLLSALACGPSWVPIQNWLTVVWGEKEFDSLEEAKKLVNVLMRLNNQIAYALSKEKFFMPLIGDRFFPLPQSPALTEAQKEFLSVWCRGYLEGVSLDIQAWHCAEREKLASLLYPIVVLAKNNRQQEELFDFYFKNRPSPQELTLIANSAVDLLPSLIPAISHFWRSQSLLAHKESKQAVELADLCPCGSGKNFRKCCKGENVLLH